MSQVISLGAGVASGFACNFSLADVSKSIISMPMKEMSKINVMIFTFKNGKNLWIQRYIYIYIFFHVGVKS